MKDKPYFMALPEMVRVEMKTVISVLTAHFFVLSAFIWLASPACADSGSDYKAGSDFAKQVQSNGLNSLKNFSGEQNLPGYTDSPDQTKYYGGVTASGDSSLKSDSALEFSQEIPAKRLLSRSRTGHRIRYLRMRRLFRPQRIQNPAPTALSAIPDSPVPPRLLTAANSQIIPANVICRWKIFVHGKRP